MARISGIDTGENVIARAIKITLITFFLHLFIRNIIGIYIITRVIKAYSFSIFNSEISFS